MPNRLFRDGRSIYRIKIDRNMYSDAEKLSVRIIHKNAEKLSVGIRELLKRPVIKNETEEGGRDFKIFH